MKLSASKVLGDRSFSKMERAVSHEGLLYRPEDSSGRRFNGRYKGLVCVGGILVTLIGFSLLTLACVFSSTTSGISRDDNNVNAVDRASTVVKTEVTDEKTMTKTLRTETSMVITTVTVTEITTTSTTTVPLGPLPPYTTTTPTTPTGPTTTWKPPTNPCRELPKDPYSITAPSLFNSYCTGFLEMNYGQVECVKPKEEHSPVFRTVLTVTELNGARTTHTFIADGNKKKDAKYAVARVAAEEIFGLNYTMAGVAPIPPAHYSCVPVTENRNYLEDDDAEISWPEFFKNEELYVGGISGDEETSTTTTYRPSTVRPLPDDPTSLSAVTLLDYTKDYLRQNYTSIQCRTTIPPVFRVQLTINDAHSFFGDSDTKRHAKERAARAAVTEMFGVDYSHATVIPGPVKPCIPVGLAFPYIEDDQ